MLKEVSPIQGSFGVSGSYPGLREYAYPGLKNVAPLGLRTGVLRNRVPGKMGSPEILSERLSLQQSAAYAMIQPL